MIKIITKASKVSKRNMKKSLNIVKKFMKMLRIMLFFEAIFMCGRIIYWFFDKSVEFCEKLLGAYFMVIGRSSFSLFSFVK